MANWKFHRLFSAKLTTQRKSWVEKWSQITRKLEYPLSSSFFASDKEIERGWIPKRNVGTFDSRSCVPSLTSILERPVSLYNILLTSPAMSIIENWNNSHLRCALFRSYNILKSKYGSIKERVLPVWCSLYRSQGNYSRVSELLSSIWRRICASISLPTWKSRRSTQLSKMGTLFIENVSTTRCCGWIRTCRGIILKIQVSSLSSLFSKVPLLSTSCLQCKNFPEGSFQGFWTINFVWIWWSLWLWKVK